MCANECLEALRTTNPQHDKRRITDLKGGLLKDVYNWVLDNQEFKQWRSGPNRLLWVVGGPGQGKTMLLCGIIDQLESEKDLGAVVVRSSMPRCNFQTHQCFDRVGQSRLGVGWSAPQAPRVEVRGRRP